MESSKTNLDQFFGEGVLKFTQSPLGPAPRYIFMVYTLQHTKQPAPDYVPQQFLLGYPKTSDQARGSEQSQLN